MCSSEDKFGEDAAQEVAAMQFAGGSTIARLAEEWEHDAEWVEDAIRKALLAYIPRRDGGSKITRKDVRKQRSQQLQEVQTAQGKLNW